MTGEPVPDAGPPTVSIGVPAYRGAAFLADTLRALQAQTWPYLDVLVALDGPDEASEGACRPLLEDPRFRLHVHPKRLGWVGNVNWLMRQSASPFWCCQPQDDLPDPRYVEVLLSHARQAPGAAVVYGDMVGFGLQQVVLTQASVTGSAVERQRRLLREHHSAVAFRGLTRIEAIRQAGDIPANAVESFSTDTVWMAAMARWGDLVRVPAPLYRKRYHAGNEHARWRAWDADTRARAWVAHCADMLEQALPVATTARERWLLWRAAVERAGSPRFRDVSGAASARWTDRRLRARFVEYVRTSGRIDIPHRGWRGWLSSRPK